MIHVDDDGFVRAPVGLVYRRLTDIERWPQWWPGVRVAALDDAQGTERWALQVGSSRSSLSLVVAPHSWRHDAGFALAVSGDLEGSGEFWLQPVAGGTVIHHVLSAQPRGAALVVMRTYRQALRRGLWGFKDALQTEVRTAVGLQP
jgi:uncharacterized protein YndB with AHSA1/START domain